MPKINLPHRINRQHYDNITLLLAGAAVTYVVYHLLEAYVVFHTSLLAERIYTENRKNTFSLLLKVDPLTPPPKLTQTHSLTLADAIRVL